MINKQQLIQRQLLPLNAKINMSLQRIEEFYNQNNGDVYVSFSGGKDSTVLLHLVRSIYPDVKAVFVDTGLEYPEIKDFVKSFNNVEIIRPTQSFKQVIDKYGYPVISKNVSRYVNDLQNPTVNNVKTRELRKGLHKKNSNVGILSNKWKFLVNAPFKCSDRCCDVMKKIPIHKFNIKTRLKAFIGTMASDSNQREIKYLQHGCNNYINGQSTPLGFWTEKDIWEYIKIKNIPYCSIYDTGVKRTGCMFCMFGIHLEGKPNRFDLMKVSHPKLYDYCMNQLNIKNVLEYIDRKGNNKLGDFK